MPRRISAFFVFVVLAGAAACIDVPDSMKAQFAPAGPNERTNYRPGNHGMAPPAAADVPVSPPDAGADAAALDLDAGSTPLMAEGGTV